MKCQGQNRIIQTGADLDAKCSEGAQRTCPAAALSPPLLPHTLLAVSLLLHHASSFPLSVLPPYSTFTEHLLGTRALDQSPEGKPAPDRSLGDEAYESHGCVKCDCHALRPLG